MLPVAPLSPVPGCLQCVILSALAVVVSESASPSVVCHQTTRLPSVVSAPPDDPEVTAVPAIVLNVGGGSECLSALMLF